MSRIGRTGQLLNKKITEPVAAEDIGRLAASAEAGRKGCPAHAVYTVVLNKADDPQRKEMAAYIGAFLEHQGVTRVIVTSFRRPEERI